MCETSNGGAANSSPGRSRYYLKCQACDQTFWLDEPAARVPEHGAWNRRLEPRPTYGAGCGGSKQPGLWIGEDLDPGAISPRAPLELTRNTSREP